MCDIKIENEEHATMFVFYNATKIDKLCNYDIIRGFVKPNINFYQKQIKLVLPLDQFHRRK